MGSTTEKAHSGGFLMSEANGKRSRENFLVEAGQDLVGGTVMGIIDNNKLLAFDPAGTMGSELAHSILLLDVNTSSTGQNKDVESAVIIRDAEVNSHEVTWDTGIGVANEDATGKTALEALGIRFRE